MILEIGFEDFKKLVEKNNKRIYYYQDGSSIDFYFITEGLITKSNIDIDNIENKEVFFDHKMFIGATKLLFNLSNKDTSVVKDTNDFIIDIIKDNYSDEKENIDIQKEGVYE